nr:aldose 1-epimerase family protein [Marinobacterium ramblicola]
MITDSATSTSNRDFHLTHDGIGIDSPVPFSIRQQTLAGGKQQGSELITLQVGDMTVRLVPTRGMAVLDVFVGDTRFGWDSPVQEVVNPAFINLEAFGGLGWLEGFNEMVVRCGYQWAGHPGIDNGELLTLHGRIQNTPASRVVLSIEDTPPYTIRLSGRVDEKCFKRCDFEVWMHLSLVPGEHRITLRDELINRGDYAREYQVIYHNNFGTPVLEAGGRVHLPVRQISPFNTYAGEGLNGWAEVGPPQRGFDEQVFNIHPLADPQGNTEALLHNASADLGVAMGFNTVQLPVLTIWKNTDTLQQGYVMGIEPGTSFAYNRRLQRDLGLVPSIGPGESRHFNLSFTFLNNATQVADALARIEGLQGDIRPEVLDTPLCAP